MSDPDLQLVAFPRESRASQIIADMATKRGKPRSVSRRDLVPPHIREQNEVRWAAEHKEMLEREAAEAKARLEALMNRPGFVRRIWRAIFG